MGCGCNKKLNYQDPPKLEPNKYLGKTARLIDGRTVILHQVIENSNKQIIGYTIINEKMLKERIFSKNIIEIYE
jgi:hypothetical protein